MLTLWYTDERLYIIAYVMNEHTDLPTEQPTTHPAVKTNSVSWVGAPNYTTERPPFVGEVSANFCA
jgi:hypothetical protein